MYKSSYDISNFALCDCDIYALIVGMLWSPVSECIHPQLYIIYETKYQSEAKPTKDTPYLALTGELKGVYCEYFGENLPRHNGTAPYHTVL